MSRNHMTVTEFEASPGRALRQARRGEVVEVTARDNVVAVISPPGEDDIRWGVGKPRGLDEPLPVVGGMQDLIVEGRR